MYDEVSPVPFETKQVGSNQSCAIVNHGTLYG
jgi:hypothetical protein